MTSTNQEKSIVFYQDERSCYKEPKQPMIPDSIVCDSLRRGTEIFSFAEIASSSDSLHTRDKGVLPQLRILKLMEGLAIIQQINP